MVLNSTKFGGNRTIDVEVGLNRRTDRQADSYIPPQTMFAGGIIKKRTIYTDRNRNRLFAVIPFTNLFGKGIFSI